MLQLIWAFLEQIADRLGFEALAATMATLLREGSQSVGALIADVFLLWIIVVAIEQAAVIARSDWRIKLVLILEAVIGAASVLYVWISGGADPKMPVEQLVQSAGLFLLVPWFFIFVISPLLLIWLALRDWFFDLGGSAVSLWIKILVFVIFAGLLWFIDWMPTAFSTGNIVLRLVVVSVVALIPSTGVLIAIAAMRRRRLRLEVSTTSNWRFRTRKSIWQAPNSMDSADLKRLRLYIRRWFAGSR